jgi:hypothetical protein
MNRTAAIVIAIVLLSVGGAIYLWQDRTVVPPQVSAPPAAEPAPSTPAPVAEPTVKHPIEAADLPPADIKLPSLAQSDPVIRAELVDWLGRSSVQSFLQLDDFVRHSTATLDNLGRARAPTRLWPVNPTPGRFTVMQSGDAIVMAPGNAERYAPLVAFVESVDSRRAIAHYVRWYPWFQRSYEELGFPGRYFNDRVIETIDLLLATPERSGPIALKLTEVRGPVPSAQPWVRYEFVDPELEALSAGQKVLIRVGPDHSRRLKAKLREIRAGLVRGVPR